MVSVKQALRKGQLMINVPVTIVLFGTMLLSFYLKSQGAIPDSYFGFSILVALVASWLYWSFAITKWRIWAFENVEDILELKSKAIEQKLIWNDGSIFERTEIRNKTEKEKWKKIEDKIREAEMNEE